MGSKVAVVNLEQGAEQAFKEALKLAGKIDDLSTPKRSVVIKVGIFDPKADHHTSVDITNAIIKSFDKAPKIYVAESDNYRGTGSERLQKWKSLFSTHPHWLHLQHQQQRRANNVSPNPEVVSSLVSCL